MTPLYAITDKNDRSVCLATESDITRAKAIAAELNGDVRLFCEAKLYFK
jgi:hypothetical protein